MKYSNKELRHYGVKGMKWGIRRSAKTTGKSGGVRKSGGLKNKEKSKDYFRDRAYKQQMSGMKMAGASILATGVSVAGVAMMAQGKKEVGSMLAAGGALAGASLGTASTVQAVRAGYNYFWSM